MTQNEVINKLSMEMALSLGDLDKLHTCRIYIQMALAIGIEHFYRTEEEIVAMDKNGVELGNFKSIDDAERKLGIAASSIRQVLLGNRHTAGGLMFIREKDKELMPARETA